MLHSPVAQQHSTLMSLKGAAPFTNYQRGLYVGVNNIRVAKTFLALNSRWADKTRQVAQDEQPVRWQTGSRFSCGYYCRGGDELQD